MLAVQPQGYGTCKLASCSAISTTSTLHAAAAAGQLLRTLAFAVHLPAHSQPFPWLPHEGLLVGPWLDPQMPLQGHALQPARGRDGMMWTEQRA
jgi:hypothetical protein